MGFNPEYQNVYRASAIASAARPAINTDRVNNFRLSALSTDILSFTTNLTGSPVDGQRLHIAITDDGTPRNITWGAGFAAGSGSLPTVTQAGVRLDVDFIYDYAAGVWRSLVNTSPSGAGITQAYADAHYLQKVNNLNDVTTQNTALQNLDGGAGGIAGLTGKTTPVDADVLELSDSAATNAVKSLTWANLKATIKTYTDTLYDAIGAAAAVLASSLQKASNLSDLANAGTARTNLGLGTSATHATGDFCQVANNLSDVTAATARTNLGAAPIASPTFTGTTTAPEFSASGLTGATAASRYVGATASGAPASGTFAVGDFVIDQTGKVWICTAAGTPGTWTNPGGGSALAFINVPLITSVATVGTWATFASGTNAPIIYNTPGYANGATINNGFQSPAGTYTINIRGTSRTDAPKVDVTIDGSVVGTIDMYAGSNADATFTLTGKVLAAGHHDVAMVVNGKNVLNVSGVYRCQLYDMGLVQTA